MEQHGIKIKGLVRYFQREKSTGILIPETYVEDHNAIYTDLQYYLAYKIGTDTVDQSLSNRFTVGGTLSSGDNGDDGIAYGTGPTYDLTHKLDTDINAGGAETENYIEFSGSIDGPLTMSGYLQLGHSIVLATDFADVYAYYSISTEIDSGRTFYFYWRITLS
jgi:hypothetical protein